MSKVKYNDIKVYTAKGLYTAYLCRGECVNALIFEGYKRQDIDNMIEEGRLLYDRYYDDPSIDGIGVYEMLAECDMCYRVSTDGVTTSWFLTEKEALDSGALMKIDMETRKEHLQRYLLNIKQIDPIGSEIPCSMEIGEDGRFITRIATHPELYGLITKPFFPDRSWKDVGFGPAIVTVTNEKDKYGFVTGKMLPFSAPTNNFAFTKWLSEHNGADCMCHKIEHATRGTFYAMSYKAYGPSESTRYGIITEHIISAGKQDDSAQYELAYTCHEDHFPFKDDIVLSCTADELISYMMYGDIETHRELKNLLKAASAECEYTNVLKYDFSTAWVEDPNIGSYPDLISIAIEYDLLRAYILPGYGIKALNLRDVSAIVCFDTAEIREIAEFMRKHNIKAAEAVKTNTRKGKLKVTHRMLRAY